MMSDCSVTDSLTISDILIVPGMYVVITRTKGQNTILLPPTPEDSVSSLLKDLDQGSIISLVN
jgi:hypothetical protein